MADWSFNNLSLTGVDAQRPSTRLPVGKYVVRIDEAKVVKSRDNLSSQVSLTMSDVNGCGNTTDFITVHTEKSGKNFEDSVRIGRERLKAILTFGGHPYPDNPRDIGTMVGLKVGVLIEDAPYQKDGETRHGTAPRRSGAYFPPKDFDTMVAPRPTPAASTTAAAKTPLDDDIPF